MGCCCSKTEHDPGGINNLHANDVLVNNSQFQVTMKLEKNFTLKCITHCLDKYYGFKIIDGNLILIWYALGNLVVQ